VRERVALVDDEFVAVVHDPVACERGAQIFDERVHVY
jgi:hypothetical protein